MSTHASARGAGAALPFSLSPRADAGRAAAAADDAGWDFSQRAGGATAAPAAPRAPAPSEAALVMRWTVEELGAVGAAMLATDAGDDDANRLSRKYRFFEAVPGELTLAEVPRLIAEYSELAQRHEALLRGVALMLETSPTGPQPPSQPPTPQLPPLAQEPPPGEAGGGAGSYGALDSLAGTMGDAQMLAATSMFDTLTVQGGAPQQQQQQPQQQQHAGGLPLNLLH
jgi:hypothetical protein